jgi:Asp-tRNA(Asn)/Glu-tRNA(Gln) amidotransferase A subunit family amidase/ketopantoate reductase
VRYLVLGCGATGAAVAACLARDGHDVLVSDPDPAVVAAVRAAGLRVEEPAGSFTVAVPAVAPDDLPDQLDVPVLVAVRAPQLAAAAAILTGRLPRAGYDGNGYGGAGYAVCLRHGLDAGILAGAVGPEHVAAAYADLDATEVAPGVVRLGERATVLVGELKNLDTERARLLASHLPHAQLAGNILGCLWTGLAQDAVLAAASLTDQPLAEVLDDPRNRPLLLAIAREILTRAPVPPAVVDGFDPADLAGSLDWLARASRRSPNPRAEAYLDLAVRRRPSEVPAMLAGRGGVLTGRLVELVQAIEQGRRPWAPSNLDLLAAHERLERLGRPLNAACAAIAAPDRAHGVAAGPLAGRPVGVKDIIAVAGVPTRCGSPASPPAPAPRDAAVVRRLRAAGAEVFATTQCLEYAAGFAHPEVGDTRNPRDPSRTAGGSSGGSAALVAAGVCELALGTDTGGSIRIPAAYCGVVGLKPTYGLLPLDGIFPLSPSCDHAGTLTATVAGSAALLAALTNPPNPNPAPNPSNPISHSGPVTFTVGVLAAQLEDPSVTPVVRDAVRAALDTLAAAGWQVTELTAPWLAELPAWEEVLAVIVAREAYLVHRDRDTSRYAEGTRALLAYGASVTGDRYAAALERQAELTVAVEASLDGVDALAGPTVGYQAPEQDPPFGTGEDHGESRFTGPYNLTGHPAVSLPVPAGSGALPAGLQLAGRRGADAALLRVAAAAERLIAARNPRI